MILQNLGGAVLFRGIQLLIGVIFVVLGGKGVYAGNKAIQMSDRRDDFKEVEAEIRESELVRKNTGGGGDTGTGGIVYEPAIVYEYTVEDETYTSDTVYPGYLTGSHDKERHESVVEKYAEGDLADAYYDPNDPSVSFLEDESTFDSGAALAAIGAVFVLVGVSIVGWIGLQIV